MHLQRRFDFLSFVSSNVGRVADFSPVNIRRPLSDLDFPRQRRIFESKSVKEIKKIWPTNHDILFCTDLNKRVRPEVLSAIESAEYLAQHISKQIDKNKVIQCHN